MQKIDKNHRIPLYYQLMDIITGQIKRGELKEDDQLPSERELCKMYDISRATVRQTIFELEREGYIYKVHGKGTFVSPEKFHQELLKFYSFTEEMNKLGKTPASKVLSFDIVSADEKLSNKMNINLMDRVYAFTRLRLADEQPMMLETTYIPYGRFPDIQREELEREPLYEILIKRFNAIFTKAEESFQPVAANEEEGKLLLIERGTPSMMIERITYEGEGIVEYTKGIARGDRFKYHVVLKK